MDKLKTIALYLPQFHRLAENDEWWGEGFTEWTAVKAAEKLFDKHNQVREPLNDNYYDLLDKKTMEWQVNLAKQYNIYGFCFYHYYFKNGRKILEKPAENLLQWKDIEVPYCFCWANETWARTWSNIPGKNSWSEKFEKKQSNGKAILLQQDYGTEEDWINHFEYLLPFFKDERYIKISGKPVFLFYKSEEIHVLNEMIDCWQTLIKDAGYEGLYLIGVNATQNTKKLDAILYQGPMAYRAPHILGKKVQETWEYGVRAHDYKKIWENAIIAVSNIEGDSYYGGFVDYDDTPRRGKMGNVTLNVTPQVFEEYLYKLAVKNMALDNDFLFINAWNEWGEGNYLEPDKKNGYKFLEAIQRVMQTCNADAFDAKEVWKDIKNQYQCQENDEEKVALFNDLNKYKNLYRILERWMTLKQKGKSLEAYFINHNYRKIIIYGFAALGRHLYEELKHTSIEVVCALDRRRGLFYEGIEIRSVEEEIPECDVIVITAVTDCEQISRQLKEKNVEQMLTLQEILFCSEDEV